MRRDRAGQTVVDAMHDDRNSTFDAERRDPGRNQREIVVEMNDIRLKGIELRGKCSERARFVNRADARLKSALQAWRKVVAGSCEEADPVISLPADLHVHFSKPLRTSSATMLGINVKHAERP